MVEEVANSVVVPIKINGDKGKAIMTHLEVGAADNVWVQAPGKTGSQKPVKERSWAQVAGSNRYDPLREVVAETQANEIKETNEELDMGPVTAAQAQPRVIKGGRTRFGKIKQLARQAVDKEYQRRFAVENSHEVQNEVRPLSSELSISNPYCNERQTGEGPSKQSKGVFALLKRNFNERHSEEVVDISDSEIYPPSCEKSAGKASGVNFGKLIDQECCNLRTEVEVDEWVEGVIGSLAIKLGLSSTMGDKAVKDFFLKLGYAKLKERQNKEANDDERELKNYELCNEEFLGDKLTYD
ncbi:hypothetical protein FRX31_012104 [Thalictrum thalictroides]|uniref:Uncharacterized protein n=1 Tax=Thalictrum thalictroides TaxID=46969 RepID=A0A7J6WNZ3_THATH|nr:hypothetical protein FRX31_012104 [Thalictrum thalictroides]